MFETFAWVSLAVVVVALLSVLVFHLMLGVPPVPATRKQAADAVRLLQAAELAPGAQIYELGCGWGGLAAALARAFPRAVVTGVELSPLPFMVAKWRARSIANLQVKRANFHGVELSAADAVVCYLMIRPMAPLAEKLDRELRPQTAVVALTFWFRGRIPTTPGPGSPTADAALYRWPALGLSEKRPDLGGSCLDNATSS